MPSRKITTDVTLKIITADVTLSGAKGLRWRNGRWIKDGPPAGALSRLRWDCGSGAPVFLVEADVAYDDLIAFVVPGERNPECVLRIAVVALAQMSV